jgi:hypothetical protein
MNKFLINIEKILPDLILKLAQRIIIQTKWRLATGKNTILLTKENYLLFLDLSMIIIRKILYRISVKISIRRYLDFTINMTNGNTRAMTVWITISTVEKEKDQVHI